MKNHRPRGVFRRISPTSVRLILGFLLPLAAFGASAILSMRNMERLIGSTDTIRRLQNGLKAALMIQSLAREQDAAQADFMLGESLAQIDYFHAAGEQMQRERLSLNDALDTDRERELAWRIRQFASELTMLFDTQLVPAVMEGDIEKIREIRRKSREPFEGIASLTRQLVTLIQGKIQEAARHAEEIRRDAVINSGMLFGASVLLAVSMALLASRSVVRPIQTLIDGTEIVGRGRLDHRISLPRRDEFGRLAESFNRMTAELRENQRRLVQAQKMASLGRLAAGVAHEINNPISIIMGYARVLGQDAAVDERTRDELKAIEEEARQCKRIVEDLLALSRPLPAVEDEVELPAVLREAAERARLLAGDCEIAVETEAPEQALRVRGDRDKLRQVFVNLARNAAEASPEGGGRVVFRARRSFLKEGGGAVVAEVEDKGVGMDEEMAEHIFDPFYSTKSNGTGLGLSIVYSIVQAHRGSISVRSAPNQGATFTISLPPADA